jgi:uncharacterized protein (TIGR02246 family)
MSRSPRALRIALAIPGLLLALEAHANDVREAVESGNRAFAEAFARGDAAAVASLYTETAEVIAPGSPIASGRDAIAGFWQATLDSGVEDVALLTREVEAAGDLAFESGLARLVAKDGSTTQARYLVVWRRIGARWMLHRDIWNSE